MFHILLGNKLKKLRSQFRGRGSKTVNHSLSFVIGFKTHRKSQIPNLFQDVSFKQTSLTSIPLPSIIAPIVHWTLAFGWILPGIPEGTHTLDLFPA